MKIVKRQNTKNGLAAIRQRLGLSQQQLADHLGINCSTVKLAEQGKRSLQTAALLKVADLEIMLASQPQKEQHEKIHAAEYALVAQCKRSYDGLFARESCCHINSLKLKARLRVMINLYNKTREWLHVIETAIHNMGEARNVEQGWEKQKKAAIKTLNRCGLPMQVLLKAKIAVLEAEANLYKIMKQQLMNELPEFSGRNLNLMTTI